MDFQKQKDQKSKFHLNLLKTLCKNAMMKCQEDQMQQKYYHIAKKKVQLPIQRLITPKPNTSSQKQRLSTGCSVRVREIKKHNYCWNSQDEINEKQKQNLSLKALGDDKSLQQQPRFHIPKLSLVNEKQLKIVRLNKKLQTLTSRKTTLSEPQLESQQLRSINNESLNTFRQRSQMQMISAQRTMIKYLMHQNEYFNETVNKLERSIKFE